MRRPNPLPMTRYVNYIVILLFVCCGPYEYYHIPRAAPSGGGSESTCPTIIFSSAPLGRTLDTKPWWNLSGRSSMTRTNTIDVSYIIVSLVVVPSSFFTRYRGSHYFYSTTSFTSNSGQGTGLSITSSIQTNPNQSQVFHPPECTYRP